MNIIRLTRKPRDFSSVEIHKEKHLLQKRFSAIYKNHSASSEKNELDENPKIFIKTNNRVFRSHGVGKVFDGFRYFWSKTSL